ncbi:MAG TPA: response regulator [Gemmatimonadales bacterium]|nr:response regulator [Gemmatimonadales bacterium]
MTATVAPLRVLFIEDEAALQLSYRRYFASRYEVATAASGADALRQLVAHPPEVAVLDMRLPDTDGIDLLRRLRAELPDLPVVITTAYLSVEPQLRVLNLSYHGYIVKPFDLDELGRAIEQAGSAVAARR